MTKKLMIQAMQQLADSRGGRCLSDTYVDNKTPLLWKCAKGHEWMAIPSNVKRGSWCPECWGHIKPTIQHMHRLAETRGGRCLSDEYINAHARLLWQCKEGHQWKAIPDSIQRGSWCAKCSGKAKLTIQHMHRLAETREGKCLSDTYVDNKTPLWWECKEGHRWKAQPNNIGTGEWCPQCYGNVRLTIQDMRHLAETRGGRCLSDTYVNNTAPLRWECKEGHRWKANARNIGIGRWCPTCSSGLGERICREFFSQLLGDSFPKTRP
jgi:queuine/archaeosine tRNA-ribosyltransferase